MKSLTYELTTIYADQMAQQRQQGQKTTIYPQLPRSKQPEEQLKLAPRIYGTHNLYERLYNDVELDEDFQKVDQENKKELLAIQEREQQQMAKSSTINLRTANCAEKQAYFQHLINSSKNKTTAHHLNQLGLDKDLYQDKRMKGGMENNERLMK